MLIKAAEGGGRGKPPSICLGRPRGNGGQVVAGRGADVLEMWPCQAEGAGIDCKKAECAELIVEKLSVRD
jgi:hypothetical protein